jgi:alpha-N-arabinofuranosidase
VGAGGNFLVTATKPEGPWSEPKYIDQEGFDPSLCFDTDGTAYYTRDGAGEDANHPLIVAARIDLHQGKLLEKPKPIFAGTGGVWSEASHLYRRREYYYLVIAEGGTYYDHSVVVARSKKPKGPFTTCPDNPVLGHANRPRHLIQATGHADLVETQDGETYAVLLGIRPKAGRYHHLGRETFLVPVNWSDDGWPIFGKHGEVEVTLPAPNLPPHPWPKANVREDFNGKKLPFEFVFVRNPEPKSHSLKARPGYLRLQGLPGTMAETDPVCFVGRRQQHFECSFSTSMEFDPKGLADEAGIVVRSSEQFHYALVVRRSSVENDSDREALLWSVIAGKKKLVQKLPIPKGAVQLEIRATAKDYEFSVGAGKRRKVLGTLPTRPLTMEYALNKTGTLSFTGVVVGLYASGQGERAQTPADFDWFDYRPGVH